VSGAPAGRPGRLVAALLLATLAAGAGPTLAAEAPTPAEAVAGDWRDEFSSICSKTQDAMGLTDAELRSLVERCEKLKPAVEKLPEAERKVYRRRLQVCRDLYQFVLDSRASGAGK